MSGRDALDGRPASLAAPIRHPLFGVLLFLSAALLLACMDASTKYLAAHYNAPLVVAIRYIVHCSLMVVVLAPMAGRALVETRRTGLVLVRAACLATASLFMTLALQRMPVAESTAIVFLAPLLVVLIAGPMLGERVGMLGWVSAVAGFSGILLIARPGGGLDPTGLACAFCAACAVAAYQLLSRLLASTERTLALLFYTALVGAVIFGLLLPWYWEGQAPTPLLVLLFVATGVLGGLGHFLFTAAHRHAPASLLAPMMYVQLLWAGLLGWVVFGHVPSRLAVLGMCAVAAAGALAAWRSHRYSRSEGAS